MPTRATTVAVPRQDLTGSFFETAPEFAPIGLQLLTPFPVSKQRGSFGRIPREALLARADVKRTARSGYSRSDWDFEDDTYSCKEYGHEELDDDSLRAEFEGTVPVDRILVARGEGIVLREQDIRIKDLLHNTTTFPLSGTTGLSVAQEWDDPSVADPKGDVKAGIKAIREKTGLMANVLQISWNSWWDLSQCEQILETLKFTGKPEGRLGLDVLANALGIERIVVPTVGGLYNSADQGRTPSYADIWTDEYAFLAVVASGSDIAQPCLGRTFHNESDGGLLTAEQYRDEEIRSGVFRVRQQTHEKVIDSAFGFLLGNVSTN